MDELFKMLCYLALVTTRSQRWEGTHPSYLLEKLAILSSVEHAFSALDHHNQSRVIRYCRLYQIPLPKEVEQWIAEAKDMGVNYE